MSILLYIMFNLCTIMLHYCLSFYLSYMYNSFIFIYYIYNNLFSFFLFSFKTNFWRIDSAIVSFVYIYLYEHILSTISFFFVFLIILLFYSVFFFASLCECFRRNNFVFSLFFFFSLFVLITEAKIN